MRTVTPFLVGAAKIAPPKFFVLNFLGAAIWAVAVGTLGYFFGHALEVIIGDLKRYEMILLAVLAGLGLAIWLVHFLKKS